MNTFGRTLLGDLVTLSLLSSASCGQLWNWPLLAQKRLEGHRNTRRGEALAQATSWLSGEQGNR